MLRRVSLVIGFGFGLLFASLTPTAAFSGAFVARKSLILRQSQTLRYPTNAKRCARVHRSTMAPLEMRDRSASYWFQAGDSVRVVADDVEKAGFNLHNRVGSVAATWEKCDVDPTCCCAEQVDINMAVRVEFQGTEADPNAAGTSFLHYFAEAELLKVDKQETQKTENSLPFDGMSCVAFKMDHIQSASDKPRGIASWEPVSPDQVVQDQ